MVVGHPHHQPALAGHQSRSGLSHRCDPAVFSVPFWGVTSGSAGRPARRWCRRSRSCSTGRHGSGRCRCAGARYWRLRRRIDGLDVGAFADEVALHHQQRVDRFMHAGRALAVAGQRLGGADRRASWRRTPSWMALISGMSPTGRRGGVRIDVIDRRLHILQRHLHAAHRALARRRHHVGAVGRGAIADHLGIDFRAARLGVFQLFQNQDAAAAGDHETVAILRS